MLVHNGKERAARLAWDVSIPPAHVFERRNYLDGFVATKDRRRNRDADVDVAQRTGRIIARDCSERRAES